MSKTEWNLHGSNLSVKSVKIYVCYFIYKLLCIYFLNNRFPLDTQCCELQFSLQDYPLRDVTIQYVDKGLINHYMPSSKWRLVSFESDNGTYFLGETFSCSMYIIQIRVARIPNIFLVNVSYKNILISHNHTQYLTRVIVVITCSTYVRVLYKSRPPKRCGAYDGESQLGILRMLC